jgi:hypothetical protein
MRGRATEDDRLEWITVKGCENGETDIWSQLVQQIAGGCARWA